MDLNPLFTNATSFRPAGDAGELKLFEHAGIQLVHGWLVDPESREYKAVTKFEDYDSAVNLVADADHTTKGQLVEVAGSQRAGTSSSAGNYTEEERQKIEDGKPMITVKKRLIRSNSCSSDQYPILPGNQPIPANIPWPIHPIILSFPGIPRCSVPLLAPFCAI